MNSPTISVVVPCYQQGHFLPECIESVRAQTFQDWELIVVDDGSPDDTALVARRYEAADSRIRLLQKPNGGVSSARNAGFREARGRYLQFLDADDLLEPQKFERDLRHLGDAPDIAIVLCDYAMLDAERKSFLHKHCEPRFRSSDPELELTIRWETDLSIPIHSGLFDARLFSKRRDVFTESLPTHEDYLMWLEVLAQRPAIHHTGTRDVFYRSNEAGVTRNHRAMLDGFLAAIDIRLENKTLSTQVKAALRRKRSLVRNSYGKGRRARVRSWLAKASHVRVLPWRVYFALLKYTRIGIHEQQAALSREFGV